MDLLTSTLEFMLNTISSEDELMNFAATWGIQESSTVRLRLLQIRNPEYGGTFVNEELDLILQHFGGASTSTDQQMSSAMNVDLDLAFDYVQEQDEVEGAVQAILFDDEIEEASHACVEDGPWSPTPAVQATLFDDEVKEASHVCVEDGLHHGVRKKGVRTFAKNAAKDTTYEVKIDEEYHGQRLHDIRIGLHQMFDDLLGQARGNLAGNDLGRVIIHHGGLHDPIIIPLQKWSELCADVVMSTIEKVLNSNQELAIDSSFEITIGSINLPKGGTRQRIIKLKGKNNSLQLKTSIVTIENEDQLCMARAIGVSWAKLNRCSPEEWKEIVKNRGKKSNLELILKNNKVPKSYLSNLLKNKRNEQRQLAVILSRMANVPLDCPASLSNIEAFEEVLGVKIMIISARLGNKFITNPNTGEHPCIYLYLVDDNHFNAITSITGFFNASYFCDKCLKHYSNLGRHECEIKCRVCKKDNCLMSENTVICKDCNMKCRSQECFDRHRQGPEGLNRQRDDDQSKHVSQCETFWKCRTCYKVINRTKRNIKDHRCGEYLCNSCKTYVLEDHLCFLRATPYKQNDSKFIFFDFECTQDEVLECQEGYRPVECEHSQPDCNTCLKCQNCKSSWCGKSTHRPNFVVAQTACDECKDEAPDTPCKKCGDRCENCQKEEKEPCLPSCGQREFIFEGCETLETFGTWLFSPQHKHYKAIAHNMKGYDGYFLLEYLIDQSIRPNKIIYSGSKIMYMTIEKGLNITIIDSLNFLHMKLAALPKTFGLTEMKKGWFPHLCNTRENQTYIGPYPDAKYYGYDFMSAREREELLAWLDSKKEETFDFRKEMLEYCRSDVDILRKACLTLKDLLKTATQTSALLTKKKKGKIFKEMCPVSVDPFNYSTIASVCMGIFKTKFFEEEWEVKINDAKEWTPARYIDGNLEILKNDTWIKEGHLKDDIIKTKRFIKSPIAQIPSVRKDSFSRMSLQWLELMSKQDGITIQHALNGGEKTLPGTRYKLDGYCAETNTAYEYHGCVFHGCPVCYAEDTIHPLTSRSMREFYVMTQKKKTYIERLGMTYKCIWEHEFQNQLHSDPKLQQYVTSLDFTDRLDPRDSFFGGRTNASRLYYKTTGDEQIKYIDFTSLYPWVNKYCQYPVGYPEIVTSNFKTISDYFGIAKVKILPPRGLYHPVLPYRSNGKLKFALCKTCADTENQNDCICSKDERAIIGTWCTPELQTAVQQGYTIIQIYEVYHWSDTTKYNPSTQEGGLFAKYINTFLKFKQEASGPPDWIKTEEDVLKYINDYFQKEGISLQSDMILKNPGLRALAKLCLNSFWGKFGQRLNMRQTQFFHQSEVDKFFQIFTDPMKQPQNFHIVAEDTLQMEWTYKNDCLPVDNKTNIYLATFKTCWARLKLYSVLEDLDRRVIYFDTDSIVYVSQPGQYDPPLGDYLGELTDELSEGEHIVEFVSAGPKNYAYKTNTNKETCKVRGFTLHFTNSQMINFDSVKQIVTCPEALSAVTVVNPRKICRDKRKRKLYNRKEDKTYQMVYTKRRRIDNFDTVPYGY
ncbi:uncharacterized protein LOC128241135 [Mya arenaria]|uniref:uncharacterized protein LOC128241135 n=1 Tax=Mya arenaria TaxID=6604 RepID=UPI0022E0DABD|nr:uncharacterized protein LOC128241135 [Mya arenaria]